MAKIIELAKVLEIPLLGIGIALIMIVMFLSLHEIGRTREIMHAEKREALACIDRETPACKYARIETDYARKQPSIMSLVR